VVATDVTCGANQCCAFECCGSIAPRSTWSQRRSSPVSGQNDGPASGSIARVTTFSVAAVRHLCRAGFAAGVCRNLWRAGVPDQPTHSRIRHTHGAGSPRSQCNGTGTAAKRRNDICWRCCGDSCRLCSVAFIGTPGAGRAVHRSAGFCDHGFSTGDSGVVRELYTSSARQPSGSDESAAAGIGDCKRLKTRIANRAYLKLGSPLPNARTYLAVEHGFLSVARTDYQVAQKVGLSLGDANKSASLHRILLDATFPQLLLPFSDFSSPSDKLL
jgi:hypothetical protein